MTFNTTIWALIFGIVEPAEKIKEIRNAHELKRIRWQKEKERYERYYSRLEIRMDSLDNQIEVLNEELHRSRDSGQPARSRT